MTGSIDPIQHGDAWDLGFDENSEEQGEGLVHRKEPQGIPKGLENYEDEQFFYGQAN